MLVCMHTFIIINDGLESFLCLRDGLYMVLWAKKGMHSNVGKSVYSTAVVG